MTQEKQDQPLNSQKKKKQDEATKTSKDMPREIGGYADQGKPEPTRYGDWEVGGRCSDF